MPTVATSFIQELVKGAPQFIEALIKQQTKVEGILPGLGGGGGFLGIGGGGGGGGGLGSLPIIGGFFAEGGIVPKGFPNDTYPARLTSGEGVVKVDTMDKLEAFLNNEGQTQVINTQVNFRSKVLADIMIELSRTGVRTVA
jgi:hypothetical protein